MNALVRYAVVLVLGLAVGIYVRGPLNLEDVAKFKWFDAINVTIDKAVALAKPQVARAPVDPAAAARVDEDLDYRIAQRKDSVEGWRSFLAAHGNGVHAQSAKAEVAKLLAAAQDPAAVGAEASSGLSTDAKTGSEVVGSAPPDAAPAARPSIAQEVEKQQTEAGKGENEAKNGSEAKEADETKLTEETKAIDPFANSPVIDGRETDSTNGATGAIPLARPEEEPPSYRIRRHSGERGHLRGRHYRWALYRLTGVARADPFVWRLTR